MTPNEKPVAGNDGLSDLVSRKERADHTRNPQQYQRMADRHLGDARASKGGVQFTELSIANYFRRLALRNFATVGEAVHG